MDFEILNNKIEGLNKQQAEVVFKDPNIPTLVEACAGTGKTTVSICRIGRLVRDQLEEPHRILSVTFTKKAAHETKERLISYLGEEIGNQIHTGNFHSIGLGMLRILWKEAGFQNDKFNILDDIEQKEMVAKCAFDTRISKKFTFNPEDPEILRYYSQIQAFKEKGLTVDNVKELLAEQPWLENFLKIYDAYTQELQRNNCCDFGDLLLYPLDIMRKDERVRNHWADLYHTIQVDEYQDTNKLQTQWLDMIARPHGRIFAVGDTDQSMYRWRGARPEIMVNFSRDWPGAAIMALEQNYRSTKEILEPASLIVKETSRHTQKKLYSERSGSKPVYKNFENEREEATAIAQEIASNINNGVNPSEIAILLRTRKLIETYTKALRDHNIPFESEKESDLMKTKCVRLILSVLRTIENPKDALAFRKTSEIVSKNVTHDISRLIINTGQDKNLIEHSKNITAPFISDHTKNICKFVGSILGHIQEKYTTQSYESIADCITDIYEKTNLPNVFNEEDIEILKEIIGIAQRFKTIQKFIDFLQLHAYRENMRDHGVQVMTVHAAKGLEFEIVFSPALEENVLPNQMAIRSQTGLDEERNIAHVLWTRAKKHLHLSSSNIRKGKIQKPSRFLREAKITTLDVPQKIKISRNQAKVGAQDQIKEFKRLPIAWIDCPFPKNNNTPST